MSLGSRESGVRTNQFTDVRGFHRNSRGTSGPPENIAPSNGDGSKSVRVTTALRLCSDADYTEMFAQSLRPSSRFLAREAGPIRQPLRHPGTGFTLLCAPQIPDGAVRIQEVAAIRERSRLLAGALPVVPQGGADTRQMVIFSLGDRVTNLSK